MNFTIYHIKPDWLRRSILVVIFLPVALAAMIFSGAVAAYENFIETMTAAKDCWTAID